MPKFGDYSPVSLIEGTELLVAKKSTETRSISLNQVLNYVESEIASTSQSAEQGSIRIVKGSSASEVQHFKVTGSGSTNGAEILHKMLRVAENSYMIPRRVTFINKEIDGGLDLTLKLGVYDPATNDIFGGMIPFIDTRVFYGKDGDYSNNEDPITYSLPTTFSSDGVISWDLRGYTPYPDTSSSPIDKIVKSDNFLIAPDMEIAIKIYPTDGFLGVNVEWNFAISFEYEEVIIPEPEQIVDLGQF